MSGTGDPNQIVAGLGVALLLLAGLWRFIGWVREAPSKPDPWDAEVERRLADPETQEVCHHCSTPQEPGAWFCEHCGNAVGPYNNLMPYVFVFSEGEVMRNSVNHNLRASSFIILGYLFCLISLTIYLSYSIIALPVLAPVYYFFFFRNLKQLDEKEKPPN